MIGALRLVARLDSKGAAVLGGVLAFAHTVVFLHLSRGLAVEPLASVFLVVGSAGLGVAIGLRYPALLRDYLRRRELSGVLRPAWEKLTRDLRKIVDRPELEEDPRRGELAEAYSEAFKTFPTHPQHARERMSEAIALSKELLEKGYPGAAGGHDNRAPECPKDTDQRKELYNAPCERG